MTQSLPARVRDEVTTEMVNSAIRETCKSQALRPDTPEARPEKGEPTMADIATIKARFCDQVISLIDKERGELAVLCPVSQYAVMQSAFPQGDDRFVVLDPAREYDILCGQIDHATQAGWSKLGELYGTKLANRRKGQPRAKKGCRRQKVRVPGQCEIARGYGTIKGKSWRAQPVPVIKGRPITPHTRHVLKRLSNTSARAHHVWLTAINDARLARLWDTRGYKHRLQADRVQVLRALQALVPEAKLADVGLLWIL